MDLERLHPRDQLVAIMNRIYQRGMTTLSGGNLSIMDEDVNVWITPAGVDKGRLTPEDIVCVRVDGTVEGRHKPSSEYAFHRAIYRWRPDLRAIVHAHSPALLSFCVARRVPDTRIIPQAERVCGPVGYAPYARPGTAELGANVAATFAQGYQVVLLENHGAATAGQDLVAAFQRLETLDFCARTLLSAKKLGRVRTLSDEELAYADHGDDDLPEFRPAARMTPERGLRQQMVEAVRRACQRNLMISTEGVVSARLDEASFLITATGIDRCSLGVEDLVLIRGGQREQGRVPSRAVRLHQVIYDRHPQIGAVITAQPPHATAFTITRQRFDTRAMSESYSLLRDVPVIPFGVKYREPERIAAELRADVPVLLLQNDGVLVTGAEVLQAYDRLEVAEASAGSLIDSLSLGGPVPIDAEEIAKL
jgi:L-fuculose-phosphate aldolase